MWSEKVNRLRWQSKVFALAPVSTCVGLRSLLRFFVRLVGCVKALKIYGYVNAHGQIVGKFRLLSDKDEEAYYRQLAVEADKD